MRQEGKGRRGWEEVGRRGTGEVNRMVERRGDDRGGEERKEWR